MAQSNPSKGVGPMQRHLALDEHDFQTSYVPSPGLQEVEKREGRAFIQLDSSPIPFLAPCIFPNRLALLKGGFGACQLDSVSEHPNLSGSSTRMDDGSPD